MILVLSGKNINTKMLVKFLNQFFSFISSASGVSKRIERGGLNLASIDCSSEFNDVMIDQIDLSNNNLKTIDPFCVQKLGNLNSFEIDNNTNFSFAKHGPVLINSDLNLFSCKGCNIAEIYEFTFSKLPKLEKLDLSINRIKSIHKKAFESNAALKVLILNSNKIKSSELSLLRSDSLKTLSCVNCEIKELNSFSLAELPKLEELNLSNNGLTTVDSKSFINNKMLKRVNIIGNPLTLAIEDVQKSYPNIKIEYSPIPTPAPTEPPTEPSTTEPSTTTTTIVTETTRIIKTEQTTTPIIIKSGSIQGSNKGLPVLHILFYNCLISISALFVIIILYLWSKRQSNLDSDSDDLSNSIFNDHDIYKID